MIMILCWHMFSGNGPKWRRVVLFA